MTVTAEVQSQTASAFDSLAERYDDLFTRSMIGRAQRGVVWEALINTFQPGAHVLELNCGTGEDALFLAQHDVSVIACDASERMIQIARQRRQVEDADAAIEFEQLATEHIWTLHPEEPFDGAFSNFSGLNCVADLNRTARDLARLVARRAPLLICVSTRFCLWEMAWYCFRGQFRKAFRRASGRTTAMFGEFTVEVHYPTLRSIMKMFSPYFRFRSCTGVGVTVPPSYLEPVVREFPWLLDVLRRIDKRISRLPWFRTIGDHMLIHFDRVEG